jgi:hypothetical protein
MHPCNFAWPNGTWRQFVGAKDPVVGLPLQLRNRGQTAVRGLNGSVLQCDVKCKIIIFRLSALLLKLM